MKPLRYRAVNDFLRGKDWNELMDIIRGLQLTVGPGLNIQRTSAGRLLSLAKSPLDSIHSNVEPPPAQGDNPAVLIGRISDYEAKGNNQWNYRFEWVENYGGASGYLSSWRVRKEPITDVEYIGQAFNMCEYINYTCSVAGNGVDQGALADNFSGFELQPCPIGNIVVLHAIESASPIVTPETCTLEGNYWFQYENGIDGVCA